MEEKKVLKVNEDITPLTSDEENSIKGGYGVVETDLIKPRWGSNNDNCSNSSLSNNDNCKCDNCGSAKSNMSYY